MNYKIMIIEDDLDLSYRVKTILERYEYECLIVSEYDKIVQQVETYGPHLILLDINLPRYDGFYWCRNIRTVTSHPIMIISGRDSNLDQILGIESGADDYLIKPFDLSLMVTKVHSLIRRTFGSLSTQPLDEEIIKQSNIKLFVDRQNIVINNDTMGLTLTETRLLKSLLQNYPQSVSRNELFMSIWDDTEFIEENTLNVNIRRIRNKLAEYSSFIEIRTICSYGYQLVLGSEANEIIY